MDDAAFAQLKLVDDQGRDWSEHKVTHDSHGWFLRCRGDAEAACKELLAYRLSVGIANVAEVRRVTPRMELVRPGGPPIHVPGDDAIIVRLVQDYSPQELTLKSLDEAAASELVYSMWIRRRDTHVGNKCYVEGVPMFFDHHIAFDEHGDAQTGTEFFGCQTNGAYAGKWDRLQIPTDTEPTWEKLQMISGLNDRAFHFVHSRESVNRHIDRFAEQIREIGDDSIIELLRESGLAGPAAERIESNLRTTRASLSGDVQLLRSQLKLPERAG